MARMMKSMAVVLATVALAGCGRAASPYSPARPAKPSTVAGSPYGQVMPGQAGYGQVMPGQPGYGQVMPGQPGYGQAMPGQMLGAQLPGQAGVPGQEGQMLKQGMGQVFAQATGFDATITSYSQGNYKQGQRVNELRKSTSEARLIWGRPNKLRGEIIKTTNSLIEGAAMATQDGQSIRVRLKGLLGFLPITVQASDPKLSNNRNHSFNATNPKTLIERFTGPSAVWTVVGQEAIGGVMCKVVRVDGVARLDGEINMELLHVDPQTFGLRRLTMLSGQTKVMEATLTKFAWNPQVSSSTFNL